MSVLQALDRYYDRMAARGEVAPPGYSWEPLGVVLCLSEAGELIDIQLRLGDDGRKPRSALVPKWFGRSGTGSTPYFLWDNTAYVLGVSNKNPAKTARDHHAFKVFHASELERETDPGLLAVLRFLESWTPEKFTDYGFDQRALSWNVGFRLEGEHQFIHERPAATVHIARLTAPTNEGPDVFCLVTGRKAPAVKLHPKIKGVDGTASAEVPLVSFNEEAFESYGRKQGFNAPTSHDAAFRYTAALTRLLDRDRSRNRAKVGDATTVFWADAAAEEAAGAAEEDFALLFNPPAAGPETDGAQRDLEAATKLFDALRHVAAGRALPDLDPRLAPEVRFHVLGLSPNAARLSVRFWLTDSFEAFARRLADHYAALAIEPTPWRGLPPSVARLLAKTTALQEKFDNIPPLLAGEVTRAVLAGTPYPRSLLAAALTRLRAGDDPASGWHAAAIRAVLARNDDRKEPPPVSLDRENASPAYQLGRMFAMAEIAQRMALGTVNATIRDRYFGAASATPASVFPLLLRGMQHHLSKLRKDGKGGFVEREMDQIAAQLPPELPRSLRLEEQGRFVIGYYHQRRARVAGKPLDEAAAEEMLEEGDARE